MSSKRWNVWSYAGEGRWMVVETGTERVAKAGADRRNATARKHRMLDAIYVALPAGEEPGPEHIRSQAQVERELAEEPTPAKLSRADDHEPAEERERVEFRIESKRPRSREWEFSPDIFTTAASIEQARRNLDKIERSTTAPGWRYRIMARTVRTIRITTSWEEVT